MYLTPPSEELPQEFQSRNLQRRALQAIALLGLLVAVFLLAPGLGDVRDLLVKASPDWLVLATLLEGLSFLSYLFMFGPVFCTGLAGDGAGRSPAPAGDGLACSRQRRRGAGARRLGAPSRWHGR